MFTMKAIIAGALAAAVPALAQDCDCYLINGSYPTYYSKHTFWDFRSLSGIAVSSPPAIPDTRQGNTDAPFTNDYFNWDSEFTQFWGPQNWNRTIEGRDFMLVNSYNNLYIEKNPSGETDTFLTMRTARKGDFQTAAEFESIDALDHASIRMRARTTGDSGACTAIFTYKDAEQLKDVQEADIEVLTRDPIDAIHYTNQPSYLEDGTEVEGASHNVTMPVPWTSWANHRLDWTPGRTTWSVNGKQLHSQTFQAPKDPNGVTLNAWSDGEEWTGEMEVGGEARQEIQWIEIVYGVTEKASCQKVCSIEDTPGSPSG